MKFTKLAVIAAITVPYAIMPAISYAAEPVKTDPTLVCELTTASGLGYTALKAGEGEKPGIKDVVTVNYDGRLASNGTRFDQGKETAFPVAALIPGFTEGLQLMSPGAKYRICIPSALAYGENGTANIPGNSDLVFDIDLLSVQKYVEPQAIIIPEAERICDQSTASGLGYKELKSGLGNAPSDQDAVLVNMVIYNPVSGEQIDKAIWQQIPMSNAAPGIAEGLKLMNPGASFRFCVPTEQLRYSADTSEKPKTINFHIDLVDVQKLSDLR